jgi:ADP-ribose pyrophosphatase YjhB (NUDIX family)
MYTLSVKSKKRTLVYLVKDGQVLLAMKKRGFGVNKWNGVGGKIELGETLKGSASREVLEEIGVKVAPRNLKRVATINFLFPEFPDDQDMNVKVYVYFAKRWSGDPAESEEMAPQWFTFDSIPYSAMWDTDLFWLEKALEGNLLRGDIYYKLDPKTKEPIRGSCDLKLGTWR